MADDGDLRDGSLDALLREHSRETPPPHIDAAILASARAATDADARARTRTRLIRSLSVWIPIAAAATLAIVVVNLQPDVSQHGPASMEGKITTPLQQEAAGPPATDKVVGSPSAASLPSENAKERADGRSRSEPDAQTRVPAARPLQDQPSFVAKSPATPPASLTLQAPALEAREGADARRRASGPAAKREESALGNVTKDAVDAWITRIRTLRDAGKRQEALDEVARFRKTFTDADARLPDDLRALR